MTKAPGQYASLTCVGLEGDKPLEFIQDASARLTHRRTPYTAKPSEQVDLGPVTCAVQSASIQCSANDATHRSFRLSPDSFTSPLIDADSVKAAQNGGNPSTFASSGLVRPATYSWGEYASFKDLTWTEWTRGQAIGSGVYSYNTCKPDCASAHYRTDPNVTVMFENPKIVCGQWFFTKLEVHDTTNPSADGNTLIAPDMFSPNSTQPCPPPSSG